MLALQTRVLGGNAGTIRAVAAGAGGNLAVLDAAAVDALTQLDQFVLALGVTFAVQTLTPAAALAIGVALYTIDWSGLRRRLSRGSTAVPAT